MHTYIHSYIDIETWMDGWKDGCVCICDIYSCVKNVVWWHIMAS